MPVTGEAGRIQTSHVAKFLMPWPTLCGRNSAVNAQNHPQIVVDPALCGGEPTVRGTRFAVADILRLMEDGDADDTLVADFPPLTLADLRACRAISASTDAVSGQRALPTIIRSYAECKRSLHCFLCNRIPIQGQPLGGD